MIKTLSEIAPFLSLLVSAFTFIVSVVLWAARKTFANRIEVDAAEKLAAAAHHRLDVLDERLKGFPGYDVTNELRDDFAVMGRSQAETTTELRLLREQLQRIDDFLRNHR